MNKSKVEGRFDNITNEDYGTMLNYVKELLDYYAKNPTESKSYKEPEVAQEGLKLEYPEAKK